MPISRTGSRRDYEGARQRFEKLSAKWPSNADVLTALASITRRQGRWEESKTYFARIVTIDPLHAGRRLYAAESVLCDARLRRRAAPTGHRAGQLAGGTRQPSLRRVEGAVYQAQGRLDDAAKVLEGFAPEPDGDLVQPIVVQAMLRRRPETAIGLIETLLAQDKPTDRPAARRSISTSRCRHLRRLAGDAAGASRQRPSRARRTRDRTGETAGQRRHPFVSGARLLRASASARTPTKHAKLAVERCPSSKDALSGAYYLDIQARVWARFGDGDAAIPALAALMKHPGPNR